MVSMKPKELYLATCVHDLNAMAEKLDKQASPKIYLKSMLKIAESAQKADDAGDQEKAYVLFMRYCSIFQLIIRSREYSVHKTYYDSMLNRSKIETAMNRIEQLQDALTTRFEELQAKKLLQKRDEERKKEMTARIEAAPRPQPDAHPGPAHPWLSPNEFAVQLRSQSPPLVFDVRPKADAESFPLKAEAVICLDPTAVPLSATVRHIAEALKADPVGLARFEKRSEATRIVLIDEISKPPLSGVLKRLKEALFEWDASQQVKEEPLSVDGGFEHFFELFPTLVANARRYREVLRERVSTACDDEVKIKYPDLEERVQRKQKAKMEEEERRQKEMEKDRRRQEKEMEEERRRQEKEMEEERRRQEKEMEKDRRRQEKAMEAARRRRKEEEDSMKEKQGQVPAEVTVPDRSLKPKRIASPKPTSEESSGENKAYSKSNSSDVISPTEPLKISRDAKPGLDKPPKSTKDSKPGPDGTQTSTKDTKPGPDGTQTSTKDTKPGRGGTQTSTKDTKPGPDGTPKSTKDSKPGPDGPPKSTKSTKDMKPYINKYNEIQVSGPSILSNDENEQHPKWAVRGGAKIETPQQQQPTAGAAASSWDRPVDSKLATYTTRWDASSSRPPQHPSVRVTKAPLKDENWTGSSSGGGRLKRSGSQPNLATTSSAEEASAGIASSSSSSSRGAVGGDHSGFPGASSIDRPLMPSRESKPENSLSSFDSETLRLMCAEYGTTDRGITGLRNLGNSCYMNSVLQALSNTPGLVHYFLSNSYNADINRNNGGEMAVEFATLVRALWAGRYRIISPIKFKRTVGRKNAMFASHEQQDSQEFLLFLLDALHEDFNAGESRRGAPTAPPIIEDEEAPLRERAREAWRWHERFNRSFIVSFFQGQFRSTVRCLTCNMTSTTFDVFMYLSLQIPSHSRCSLRDCISQFSKEERMSGSSQWHCPRCRQSRDAVKNLALWRLPPYLFIHLKRFSFEQNLRAKMNTLVDFPLQGMQIEQEAGNPNTYDLYAVSNHYGSMESGHYTAYCLNPGVWQWFKFDDDVVSPVREDSIRSSAAYILMYATRRGGTGTKWFE